MARKDEKDEMSFYEEDSRELQLEDDEMSHEEACFMQGYEESSLAEREDAD